MTLVRMERGLAAATSGSRLNETACAPRRCRSVLSRRCLLMTLVRMERGLARSHLWVAAKRDRLAFLPVLCAPRRCLLMTLVRMERGLAAATSGSRRQRDRRALPAGAVRSPRRCLLMTLMPMERGLAAATSGLRSATRPLRACVSPVPHAPRRCLLMTLVPMGTWAGCSHLWVAQQPNIERYCG